jgi:UDP-galactopyranose mutase
LVSGGYPALKENSKYMNLLQKDLGLDGRMLKKYDYLIVGAGISGSVLAERIANVLGKTILIIDKRKHVAGNCYDYIDEKTGILVHKYGPHVFHTNNRALWDYLSEFTDWEVYFHKANAILNGTNIDLPFNLNSIYQVFSPYLADLLEKELVKTFEYGKRLSVLDLRKEKNEKLTFLANFVFEKIFLGYTIKQWGIKPDELDESVINRVPIMISRDSRYFQDSYQGIPQKGYTKMIENMLKSNNIEVLLETDFGEIKETVKFDHLIYTGAIDEFFSYELGELPYRSLRFVLKYYDKEYYQRVAQVNYPENYTFTRTTEFKHFLDQKTVDTVVAYEYPEPHEKGKNEAFYPIPNHKNYLLYKKYYEKTQKLNDVLLVGRLGQYRYFNMDEAVHNALSIFENIKTRDR